MSIPIFYKVNLKKKLEIIKSDVKSLHHQRSILIVDFSNEVIWMVNGKNINSKLLPIAKKSVDIINTDLKINFVLKNPPSDIKNITFVKNILQNKDNNKAKKIRKISSKSVPKIKISPKSQNLPPHILHGDLATEGPEIPEFKIAYFEEKNDNISNILSHTILLLQILNDFSKGKISEKSLRKKIDNTIDQIIRG